MDRSRVGGALSREACLWKGVGRRFWLAGAVAGVLPLVLMAYLVGISSLGAFSNRMNVLLMSGMGLLAVGIAMAFIRAAVEQESAVVFNAAGCRSEPVAPEIVDAFAAALRAKDLWTHDHCERVARRAEAIGKEMGLGVASLIAVRHAARLHDIGMIALNDRVLEKRGRLTEEDKRRLSGHPVAGKRIN